MNRSVMFFVGSLAVVTCWPGMTRSAVAGPLEDFYAFEEQMAQAQDAYDEARNAIEEKEGDKAEEALKKLPDPRPDLLKKMDAMADQYLGKPDGAFMAMASFGWSWNLDLDSPNLLSRFERVVKTYPDEAQLVDVLPDALNAALAIEKPERWAEAVARLAKTTKDKDIKTIALLTLGQLHLATQKPSEATVEFKAVLALEPEKELAAVARGYLYEIEHLQVGKPAPEFTTKTVDGREVSLKSLRGKAVLLDFWATWCGPCVVEIPHLKEAAEKLSGKPFEILAVSLDDERVMLTATIEQRKLPGIQTWDPTSWDEHPVRTLYNVQQLPTWYLIDAGGVIRARDPLGKKLIPAVERVLAMSKGTEPTDNPSNDKPRESKAGGGR